MGTGPWVLLVVETVGRMMVTTPIATYEEQGPAHEQEVELTRLLYAACVERGQPVDSVIGYSVVDLSLLEGTDLLKSELSLRKGDLNRARGAKKKKEDNEAATEEAAKEEKDGTE